MVYRLKRRSLVRARLFYEYQLFASEHDAAVPDVRPPKERQLASIRHLAFGYEEMRFRNKLKQYAFLLDVGFYRPDDAYVKRKCERLIAQLSTALEAHRLLLETYFSEDEIAFDQQVLDTFQKELATFTAKLKQ